MSLWLQALSGGWQPGLPGYCALAAVMFTTGLVPVPRTPLVIASGLVFGLFAVPVISLASLCGSITAFLLGRSLLRERVRRWLTRWRLSAAVLRAVDLEGWRVVALLRFYGPLPTTVQNYGFALTTIALWRYAAATLVFSLPQITFYTYLGSLGRRGSPDAVSYATAAVAAGCAVTVVAIVGRRVRTILRRVGASEADLAGAAGFS